MALQTLCGLFFAAELNLKFNLGMECELRFDLKGEESLTHQPLVYLSTFDLHTLCSLERVLTFLLEGRRTHIVT